MIVALNEHYENIITIDMNPKGFGWPEEVPENLIKAHFRIMKQFENNQKKLWKIYIDGDKKDNKHSKG
jgi:hypothetical protein